MLYFMPKSNCEAPMRIKYNAPVVLTFAFASLLVLVLSQTLLSSLTEAWFTVPGRGGFSASRLRDWVCLLSHALGHAHWSHWVSNISLILLLGPILEETYGSSSLLLMLGMTAFVTGGLNVLFFSSGLLGASGVVFMLILLASFSNFSKGEIPLTFLLVLLLYLGKELYNAFASDVRNISVFAHLMGGLMGSLFGFFRVPRAGKI